MSFKVTDNKLLRRYIKMWKSISSSVGKKFDSESVHGDNDKYIETKIKIYRDKVNTKFQGKNYQNKIHHVNFYQ